MEDLEDDREHAQRQLLAALRVPKNFLTGGDMGDDYEYMRKKLLVALKAPESVLTIADESEIEWPEQAHRMFERVRREMRSGASSRRGLRATYAHMGDMAEIACVLDRMADAVVCGHKGRWETARDILQFGTKSMPSVLKPAILIWEHLVKFEATIMHNGCPDTLASRNYKDRRERLVKELFAGLKVPESLVAALLGSSILPPSRTVLWWPEQAQQMFERVRDEMRANSDGYELFKMQPSSSKGAVFHEMDLMPEICTVLNYMVDAVLHGNSGRPTKVLPEHCFQQSHSWLYARLLLKLGTKSFPSVLEAVIPLWRRLVGLDNLLMRPDRKLLYDPPKKKGAAWEFTLPHPGESLGGHTMSTPPKQSHNRKHWPAMSERLGRTVEIGATHVDPDTLTARGPIFVDGKKAGTFPFEVIDELKAMGYSKECCSDWMETHIRRKLGEKVPRSPFRISHERVVEVLEQNIRIARQQTYTRAKEEGNFPGAVITGNDDTWACAFKANGILARAFAKFPPQVVVYPMTQPCHLLHVAMGDSVHQKVVSAETHSVGYCPPFRTPEGLAKVVLDHLNEKFCEALGDEPGTTLYFAPYVMPVPGATPERWRLRYALHKVVDRSERP
jgi:hypothetical protein